MDTFTKDPNAKLNYEVDWSDWLPPGVTITESTFLVPVGITKESEVPGLTSTMVWLSGGTSLVYHLITNRITTSAGHINDHSFYVWVAEQ